MRQSFCPSTGPACVACVQEQVLGGRIRVDVPAREIEYQCAPLTTVFL